MKTQKADGQLTQRAIKGSGNLGVRKEKPSGVEPAREMELKFTVPALAREALLPALEKQGCRTAHLTSRYFDSLDACLASSGISLRLRQADERWFQTLKVRQGNGIHDRLEHELEVPAAKRGEPSLDLTRHDDSPAGAILRQALQHRQAADLVERYRTDMVRRSLDIFDGDTHVELALDQGQVRAGDREEAVCELELELKSGDAGRLCALGRAWAGQYGLWLSTESKSARGERLLGLRQGMPVVKASPPKLDARMSEEALLRAIVRSCMDQILPNAGAIAAGSRDHDHVHQLRVGLRRLRTALRELGDLSDEWSSAWEKTIGEAFRQLGAYRDREAVLEAIKPKILKAGAAGAAWMGSESEAADPVATVRDPQFQAVLLDALGFALAVGPDSRSGGESKLRGILRKRLKSLHRRVVDDGMRFKRLAEPAQHQVRKRLKRLRYLSEFAGSLFGQPAVDAYLDNLRPAQDALGEHNDYAVANELAHHAAGRGDPDAQFALEWLKEQQKRSAKASRQAIKAVDTAPRFWKKSAAVH